MAAVHTQGLRVLQADGELEALRMLVERRIGALALDVADVRDAEVPADTDAVARLWLDYLSWANDELDTRYGFRLPVGRAIQRDIASIGKFLPPDGRLVLASANDAAVGTAALQRLGGSTAEIKRMWVAPGCRHGGIGGAMLDRLVTAAEGAGYAFLRLDSPIFMTAAHALYRSRGFMDIPPYSESEIPEQYRAHWVFMERAIP